MTTTSRIRWQTGNGLRYTLLGLVALSWWLCCGNFCVSMAVNAVPTLMNVLINPIVSTASDRTRP